jgi:hypothetical protein
MMDIKVEISLVIIFRNVENPYLTFLSNTIFKKNIY